MVTLEFPNGKKYSTTCSAYDGGASFMLSYDRRNQVLISSCPQRSGASVPTGIYFDQAKIHPILGSDFITFVQWTILELCRVNPPGVVDLVPELQKYALDSNAQQAANLNGWKQVQVKIEGPRADAFIG